MELNWPKQVDDGQTQLLELMEEQSKAMRLLVEDICSRLKEGSVQESRPSQMVGKRMSNCVAVKPKIAISDNFDPAPPSPGAPTSPGWCGNGSMGSYPGQSGQSGDEDAMSNASSSLASFIDDEGMQAAIQKQNTDRVDGRDSKQDGGTPSTPRLRTGKTMEAFLSENPQAPSMEKDGRFRYLLDYLAGGLVLLNSLVMLLEFELEGNANGKKIGISDTSDQAWNSSMPVFRALDVSFVVVFLLEWIFRLYLDRMQFMLDFANWFDTLCVVSGVVDMILRYSLEDASEASRSVVILRLMRALKSLRAIRMVRSLRFFRGLRVLVRACQCFLPSLCWSMVLLGVFMTMGALMMGNLLQAFILDEGLLEEDRHWIWERYGTAYRATYTLFEITFAGNWPVSVRPVLEKASHAFVIFFVLYVTVVVFAVIRVISAVFLKDTFDAAQNDAEQLVIDKLRLKSQYISKLERIFRAIDAEGEGVVTEDRLMQILANPKVAAYFQTLDLDVHEGRALFHLLDNGDGEVTLEEFIDGIMRCKGTARAIDQVAMHADLKQLNRRIGKLYKDVHLMMKQNNPDALRGFSHDHRGHRQAEHLKVFRIDASMSMSPDGASWTSPRRTSLS